MLQRHPASDPCASQFYSPPTSLKRKLEETISILEATLDATHDGILVVDQEGHISRYNRQFVELWKIPQSVLETHDDSIVIQFVVEQLKEPKVFLDKVQLLYSQPDSESRDELSFKDGRVVARYSKPQFIHGRTCGRVWSFRDISKQKVAEAKQKELLDCEHRLRIETETNLQLREDFLSIASHELRTPLTPLSLQLQIMQRFLKRPEVNTLPDCKKQLDLISGALTQVNRITRLVEDLLDVSRISTGRLSLKMERFNFCEVVREVLDRYSSQLKSAKCEVKLDCPDDIHGQWDRLRVDQVVTNLISNAMKFGMGKPIHISADSKDDRVILKVKDHGIGVAKEDHERLFNRFERAVSHRQYGGLGLGLYIVKQILEGHGGGIRVDSELNQGSTFTVELPRIAEVT